MVFSSVYYRFVLPFLAHIPNNGVFTVNTCTHYIRKVQLYSKHINYSLCARGYSTVVIVLCVETFDCSIYAHNYYNESAFQSGISEWKCILEWNIRVELNGPYGLSILPHCFPFILEVKMQQADIHHTPGTQHTMPLPKAVVSHVIQYTMPLL